MVNIHASSVCLKGKGVLIMGASGAGKSDLCLRLIVSHNAVLVADDRVDLNVSRETIVASPPPNLCGLLEVRGGGILELPYLEKAELFLAVELVDDPQKVERLPNPAYFDFDGCSIPLIKLWPFAASAPDKIISLLNYPFSSK